MAFAPTWLVAAAASRLPGVQSPCCPRPAAVASSCSGEWLGEGATAQAGNQVMWWPNGVVKGRAQNCRAVGWQESSQVGTDRTLKHRLMLISKCPATANK